MTTTAAPPRQTSHTVAVRPEGPSRDSGPRIIKAGADPATGTPVAFNLNDLRRAADGHLDTVRASSRKLVADAATEADRLRRDAVAAGRAAGYAEGERAARAEFEARVETAVAERTAERLETALPALGQLADALARERDDHVFRWETQGVRLAVAVAGHLLRRTLAADPAAAVPLMAEALRLAAAAPEVTVRLNPTDHATLDPARLATAAGRSGPMHVVADDAVTAGGCVVETRHGQIDARVETLLARVAEELLGESIRTAEITP